MTVTTKLQVRTYECDSYSHVNNAVYLNYLETSRMDFLHKIGFDYKGLVASGYYLYVTHVDIHYKASSFLDDILLIDTTSTKLEHVKGEFLQLVYKKGKEKEGNIVCAEAKVTWACVNKTGRPVKLPEEFYVEGLNPSYNPTC